MILFMYTIMIANEKKQISERNCKEYIPPAVAAGFHSLKAELLVIVIACPVSYENIYRSIVK